MARSRNRSFTLEDVRRSYTANKAWAEFSGDLPARFLFRPLSFYLTVPLLSLGVSAMAVTLLGGLCTLAMFGCALWAGPRAYLYVGSLGLIIQVLDCVDGNLARTRKSASLVGTVADGAVDLLFWPLLLASIGLLAAREGLTLSPYALVLSLSAGALVLLSRGVRDVLVTHSGERAVLEAAPPTKVGFFDGLIIAVSGLDQLYALGVLIAGAYAALSMLLVLIMAYVSLMFVGSLILTLSKAARLDRERRRAQGLDAP